MSEELIKREFSAELHASGDGRTLDVRIIPYKTRSRVSDNGRDFYDEEWLPGAFDKQLNAANRVDVLANFEHQQGISGVIARGTELRDSDTALEGTFRMLNHGDADKALELVNEDILTGVSVEAIPLQTERVGDVVQRVKARLVNIALCRSPAFPDAQVLAVREAPPEDEPVPEPPPDNPERTSEVDELLARVGYEPIVRRALSKRPWDGSSSKYEDAAAYCSACLIDKNPEGEEKTVARCMLPVFEPNGDLNANALSRAAGRLNQVGASPAEKADAARKLVRLYRTANLDAPPALRQMAAR